MAVEELNAGLLEYRTPETATEESKHGNRRKE